MPNFNNDLSHLPNSDAEGNAIATDSAGNKIFANSEADPGSFVMTFESTLNTASGNWTYTSGQLIWGSGIDETTAANLAKLKTDMIVKVYSTNGTYVAGYQLTQDYQTSSRSVQATKLPTPSTLPQANTAYTLRINALTLKDILTRQIEATDPVLGGAITDLSANPTTSPYNYSLLNLHLRDIFLNQLIDEAYHQFRNLDFTIPDASQVVKGLVELATNLETQQGGDTTKAVTPAGLNSRTASTTQRGLVELATQSETRDDTITNKVITPAGLSARIASTTLRGLVELATQSETNAGTTGKVVTADTLNGRIATTTLRGLVELATQSETNAGTAGKVITADTLNNQLNSLNLKGSYTANFQAVTSTGGQNTATEQLNPNLSTETIHIGKLLFLSVTNNGTSHTNASTYYSLSGAKWRIMSVRQSQTTQSSGQNLGNTILRNVTENNTETRFQIHTSLHTSRTLYIIAYVAT